jgi:hypothetical protein
VLNVPFFLQKFESLYNESLKVLSTRTGQSLFLPLAQQGPNKSATHQQSV